MVGLANRPAGGSQQGNCRSGHFSYTGLYRLGRTGFGHTTAPLQVAGRLLAAPGRDGRQHIGAVLLVRDVQGCGQKLGEGYVGVSEG